MKQNGGYPNDYNGTASAVNIETEDIDSIYNNIYVSLNDPTHD